MEKLNLNIPESFYAREERCGYWVETEMKKVWAVELDLLNEFMNVCNEHNIKFYVGAGTMLGAVRHKGFIPWDDDIDLYIRRTEYEKLVSLARKGCFREPYFWQDHISDPGYLGGPSRLMNLNTTSIAYGHLNEKHGIQNIHMGIYIDVFPLDNIPDDKDEASLWLSNIKKVSRKAWNLRMYTHRGLLKDDKDLEWLSFYLNLIGKPDMLFETYYMMLGKYAKMATEKCCVYSDYCRNIGTALYDNKDYEGLHTLPFEMLHVPLPDNYENLLVAEYGDWHKFVIGGSVHDIKDNGLFFDTELPYTYYVNERGIKKEVFVQEVFKKTGKKIEL